MVLTGDARAALDLVHEGAYAIDRQGRITYWNAAAEALSGYRAHDVLGRRCRDGVLVHVSESDGCLCEDKCPMQATMTDGVARGGCVFMQRHDGSRLPVRVRIAPIHSRRGRIAGALQVFQPAAAGGSAQRLDQLERAALMDDLTGIANRRLARQTLQKRLEELRRYGWPFGVLLLDIDHFKQVNDSRGHDAGDEVLKVVARTLEQSVRPFDLVSRWGGEEFVVIAANLEASQLRAMADRLRLLIETSMTIIRGLPLRVTVSVGATMAQPDDTSRDVVARADALMYRSKRAGRNCVTAAAEAA